ncbi:MAG: class I SAM-dependent methyltransferase, partial [Saprospiraceae bacterium]
MKDLFSNFSADYARFRPGYPAQLFDFLFSICENQAMAWDAATGNGQIAVGLSERFDQVMATDISANQLASAEQRPNIQYAVGSAEAPDFPDHAFDLLTVGQAAHWFEFEAFYQSARRVLKPGGILALIGYNVLQVDAPTDAVFGQLYHHTLEGYWDPERQYVYDNYSTIPFPFEEIPLPEMARTYSWTLEQLLGYLHTWSAVKRYTEQTGRSPLDKDFVNELRLFWAENEVKLVRFPTFARI